MSYQTGAAARESDNDIERRAGLTQDTKGKQRTTNRPNDRMHCVPGGIDPRDFVGEKLEHVECAREPENERVAKDGERLILRRQHHPMQMNRESGEENGEVKINAGEAGETEGHSEQFELVHGELCERNE